MLLSTTTSNRDSAADLNTAALSLASLSQPRDCSIADSAWFAAAICPPSRKPLVLENTTTARSPANAGAASDVWSIIGSDQWRGSLTQPAGVAALEAAAAGAMATSSRVARQVMPGFDGGDLP